MDRPEALSDGPRLPPGQYVSRDRPVVHYGRVPAFRPETWDFRVLGATADGEGHRYGWPEFGALPRVTVLADLHCVTKFSIMGVEWGGVAARTLLDLVPPAAGCRHVMLWGEYGYSANVRLADFAEAVFALEVDGKPLAADRGHPLRVVVPHLYAWKSVKWVRSIEYLVEDRRGFWEDRGYHNVGDPWREQRYSYQEEPGEGPP